MSGGDTPSTTTGISNCFKKVNVDQPRTQAQDSNDNVQMLNARPSLHGSPLQHSVLYFGEVNKESDILTIKTRIIAYYSLTSNLDKLRIERDKLRLALDLGRG